LNPLWCIVFRNGAEKTAFNKLQYSAKEKYHELDIFANKEVKETFAHRSHAVKAPL